MSKACVLIAFVVLAGCGSAPPKADVPMSAVVGEYHGYMEPNVVEMDPVEQGIMKAVRFSMLTIKEDGSYTVVVDHPDRKKDNGKLLDQGTVVIQGKSLTFKPRRHLIRTKSTIRASPSCPASNSIPKAATSSPIVSQAATAWSFLRAGSHQPSIKATLSAT
jgi:hypothetical protein